MRGILITGLVIILVGALTVLAIPVLAHGQTEGDKGTVDQETWETMHEACEEGNWDAMVEAAEEVHEELGYAPCHGDDYQSSEDGNPNSWGGMMGGHMGGSVGMMGW